MTDAPIRAVAPTAGVDRQLPAPGETFLDHVGCFVADPEAAADALYALGFRPTPWTVQTNPDPHGGPPVLTGTGNRCVMLRRGYLEILAKTADTPLGAEFDAAMTRYAGVHLVALATANAAAERGRLQRQVFAVRALVDLRRTVAEERGAERELAFSVARVAPGAMQEGRIQFLTHHTEDAMWQPRWLSHPNSAETLTDQIIVVADLVEATDRWERFLSIASQPLTDGRLFQLQRGRIVLLVPEAAARAAPGIAPPVLPFMAATALGVADIALAMEAFDAIDIAARGTGRVTAVLPRPLGRGALHFIDARADPPWLA